MNKITLFHDLSNESTSNLKTLLKLIYDEENELDTISDPFLREDSINNAKYVAFIAEAILLNRKHTCRLKEAM